MNPSPFPKLFKPILTPWMDWPITRKVPFLMLGPAFLVLAATLVLTAAGLNRFEFETGSEDLQVEARMVGERFTEWQENLRTNAAMLASDPLLLEAVNRKDRDELQRILLSASVRSGFDYLVVGDAEAETLGAVLTFDSGDASSEFAKTSRLGLLEIRATEMVHSPQGWVLLYVTPIKSSTGLAGVLTAGRLLDSSALSALNFGRPNPRLVVFDDQGRIGTVGESNPESDAAPAFAVDMAFWAKALSGETILSQVEDGGETKRMAYVPVMIGDIPVAVFGLTLSTAKMAGLRDQLLWTNFLVSGAIAVLAVLGTLFIVIRFLARPIIALAAGADRVAAGDLSVTVPGTERRDELGKLALSFNQMTSRMKLTLEGLERRVAERTKALSTAGEVSRRLSTLLDEKQLVVEVVEQVQRAFQYYHAHIYFFDAAGENLVMAGGTGEVGRILLARGHQIPRGKGLVGRSAEENAPVLVGNTAEEPAWLPNALLPETRSEAAVPISIGDQVLGVLDVQQNTVDGLTQTDVDMLQAIANQVAIAVRNARSYTQVSRRAEREALIASIGRKIQETTTIDTALQIAVRELGRALGSRETRVTLSSVPQEEAAAPAGPKNGGAAAAQDAA